MKRKPKLLAPAGDFDKLVTALDYGADCVYVGGKAYGLRANAGNFDNEEIKKAAALTHKRGGELYLTVNILAHNAHIVGLQAYIREMISAGVDGFIAADAGVIALIRALDRGVNVSLSTQASCTNYAAARFWHTAGVDRVILARELSKEEIALIRKETPQELEIEIFVHGAMCIAYSGRCLLSSVLAGRSANLGDCAQPCRWGYYVVEETRPGEYMPVLEDENGTYVFNSKDLCLIEHIGDIIDIGVDVMKIEGRMKSEYYIATVVGAYRKAIDAKLAQGEEYVFNPALLEEVKKISYREYTTGFFLDKPDVNAQAYDSAGYIRDWEFAGVVEAYDAKKQIVTVRQRNKVWADSDVEIIGPDREAIAVHIGKLYDEAGDEIESAPNAMQIFKFLLEKPVKKGDMLRQQRR